MNQDEQQSIAKTVALESKPITKLFRDAVGDDQVAHDLYEMLDVVSLKLIAKEKYPERAPIKVLLYGMSG